MKPNFVVTSLLLTAHRMVHLENLAVPTFIVRQFVLLIEKAQILTVTQRRTIIGINYCIWNCNSQ